MLTKPDFTLPTPNTAAATTDQVWWLSRHMLAAEPTTRNGGTYANKPGFHNKGSQVRDSGVGNRATDYSIRDAINRQGAVWRTHSSAWDWTFTTAQGGDYALIDRYTSRLVRSAQDDKDPRLDLVLFEFYGQADSDTHVEGYDEYHERDVSSDSSHLWHIHMSFRRSAVNNWWGMWALYTVLTGQSVGAWKVSLPDSAPPPPAPKPPSNSLPKYTLGTRQLRYVPGKLLRGTDVQFVQRWIGPDRAGTADGTFGERTKAGVAWYQRMRGLTPDGIVGPRTWGAMGVRR